MVQLKLSKSLSEYPIPILAFIGLVAGLVLFLLGATTVAHWIWYVTLVGGGAPVVFKTFKGMLHGEFAADIVALLAIVTAVFMNEAFAGAIVVLMQSGGEALEKYGLARASSSLKTLLERAPKKAFRKTGETLETIDVQQVKIGDTLLVRPGDLIPVDGSLIHGEGEIDESALTGEPLAHKKTVGAKLFSGSINTSGVFEMRADKLSHESQYAKIVELVKKAQAEKAPVQRLADRYAVFFTPIVIVVSLLGWWITQDPTTLLAVLVVATPCPLILATPVAVISGINRAAESGIIVKGGAPLEQIGKISVAVFDKTGTITYGTPQVDKVISFDEGFSENDILYKAASVLQLSSHSAAQAILQKGKKVFEKLSFPEEVSETAGLGVEGKVDGVSVVVGSETFLEKKLGKGVFKKDLLEKIRSEGKLITCVGVQGKWVGFITLSDQIRSQAAAMIQRLHTLKIDEVVMLTGDSIKNAEIIAKQAGITNVKASLLPEQKVVMIQELKRKSGGILMVGDGINDAPALAAATVGIAMGAQGTAISAEAADIVLIVDDVGKVAEAVYIGQRMLHIALQGIWIGMGLSGVLMGIAALGYIPPPVGALLQEVIDVAVILNALRAR